MVGVTPWCEASASLHVMQEMLLLWSQVAVAEGADATTHGSVTGRVNPTCLMQMHMHGGVCVYPHATRLHALSLRQLTEVRCSPQTLCWFAVLNSV